MGLRLGLQEPHSRHKRRCCHCGRVFVMRNSPICICFHIHFAILAYSDFSKASGVNWGYSIRNIKLSSLLSQMEQFLRSWRQDALNKHQYDSAIFVGDKLLALTSAPFALE